MSQRPFAQAAYEIYSRFISGPKLFARIFIRMMLAQKWSVGYLLIGSFIVLLVTHGSEAPALSAIFQRAVSVSYPNILAPNISVVIVTDDTLRAQNLQSTVLPYAFHATMLRKLATYRPRAVMLDMFFYDERPDPGIDDLLAAMSELHATGTRVYVGVSPAKKPPLARADLLALAATGAISLVSIDWYPSNPSYYPLKVDVGGHTTFALQAYNDLCDDIVITRCQPIEAPLNLEIWWGAPPSSVACAQPAGRECRQITQNAFFRFVSLCLRSIGVGNEPDPITLNYHPTVQAEDLLTENVTPVVSAYLKNSVLFYGVDFDRKDRFHSDVYGGSDSDRTVPGVFAHAMALDNLLALGNDFIRSQPAGLRANVIRAATFFIICALSFGILCFGQALLAYPNLPDGKRDFTPGHTAYFTVSLTIIVVGCFYALHLPPHDLAAYLFAPSAGQLPNFVSGKVWGRHQKSPAN